VAVCLLVNRTFVKMDSFLVLQTSTFASWHMTMATKNAVCALARADLLSSAVAHDSNRTPSAASAAHEAAGRSSKWHLSLSHHMRSSPNCSSRVRL